MRKRLLKWIGWGVAGNLLIRTVVGMIGGPGSPEYQDGCLAILQGMMIVMGLIGLAGFQESGKQLTERKDGPAAHNE